MSWTLVWIAGAVLAVAAISRRLSGTPVTPGQYVRVAALLGAAGSLSFTRKQESEADHIGLIYMARAGYDPHQAVAFWQRMAKASKGKEPPEFLSDHPSDQHRIERVRGWLPEAEKAYTARG